MTSGTVTSGGASHHRDGRYYLKQWGGSDGKTEVWPGGIRVKWNPYSMVYWGWISTNTTGNDGAGGTVNYTMSDYRSLMSWDANDDIRTLNKLAESIRGHSFDLGVNIAESKKTYGTIVGNLRSIGSALFALKRGHVTDALRQLQVPGKRVRHLRAKDVTGRWLEMQYAWRPLVSQSFEAAKALEALTGPRVLRFRVSSGTKRRTIEGSPVPNCYKYPIHVTYSKKLIAELSEDVGVGRSLGLMDPVSVLWELVPYSFVVDWFLPIGSYLSALGQIPAMKGRFLTIERGGQKGGDFTRVGSCAALGYPPNFHKVDRHFRYERTYSTSLSVPRPTFNKLPRALSPKHILNAISLIHQRLSD